MCPEGSPGDLLDVGYEELYQQAPCGVVFARPDGRLVRANATFLAWTGYAPENVLNGLRVQDLLTIPGRLFYDTRYFPLLQMQGAVNEVAFDLVRKDGSRLPVLINSVLKTDKDGRPAVITSTIFDATQRRQYEQELLLARQRVEQLAAIVTHSGDAIVSASPDGAIESANEAADRLFSVRQGELVGRNIWELLVMTGPGSEPEPLLERLAAGAFVQIEAQARRRDGEPIDVSIGVTPHTGLLGELSLLSFVMRDIRERRAVERMRDELVAIVSHDLRSPLAFIVGVSDLLRERDLEQDDQRRMLQLLGDEARRLSELVDDFLDIQRIEAGAMRVEPVPLDLCAILQRAVDAAGPDDARPISLAVCNVPPALADEKHVQQVVTNLLSNARKYSPAGGEIRVSARERDGFVEVTVQDNGLGIPSDALPNLFQKFYRVQSRDRSNIVGTGLGLAICRRIVEAYGGSIRAESAGANHGSTFTFTVPAAPAETSLSARQSLSER